MTISVVLTPTLTQTLSTPPALPADFCAYWRGVTEPFDFFSEQMGEEVRYLVHLPPCYAQYPQRAYPVLYLLHGWPLDEYHWESLGVTEMMDDWISRGLVGPFIIVMPGVNSEGKYVHSSGGPGSFEAMLVQELLPRVESDYRVWAEPQGRAIGGISRGGVWALAIGMRYPELFMTVGGHSPALSVNNPHPSFDPYRLAASGLPGQRVYLDAGNVDWARGGTLQLYEILVAADADVTFELHAGDHVDALWQRGLPDYLRYYTSIWPASVAQLPTPATPESSQGLLETP